MMVKDANYGLEHLLLLMHVMDTNVSHLDRLVDLEWAYLNGRCDAKLIENLKRNFIDYCEHIKVTVESANV